MLPLLTDNQQCQCAKSKTPLYCHFQFRLKQPSFLKLIYVRQGDPKMDLWNFYSRFLQASCPSYYLTNKVTPVKNTQKPARKQNSTKERLTIGNLSTKNGKHSGNVTKSAAPTASMMMTTMCDSFSCRSNLHHLYMHYTLSDTVCSLDRCTVTVTVQHTQFPYLFQRRRARNSVSLMQNCITFANYY